MFVNFIAVLHNKNSVKEIYEFIYSHYHKIPAIIELSTKDSKPEKKDILERMFNSKLKSEFEYQKGEFLKIPGIQYESSFFHDLTSFIRQYNINYYISNKTSLFISEEKFFPTGTCLPFSLKMFLTTKNNLLPCEKINFKYALGRVDENVQIDAYEITKKYNNYFKYAIKICQKCYNYKFCGSCIFHFGNLEKSETEELVCDYFQNQERFEKDMYRYFSYLEKYPNDFFYILESLNID